ncbi:MAG: fumarate hydratase [Chloroflexi bacterium]|nr:fumarate hydratase [Chloroflexota bacterium]
MVRDIQASQISEVVSRLCQDACLFLPEDVLEAIRQSKEDEVSPAGKSVLQQLLDNAAIAEREAIPLCQDTGVTVVYLEVGQDAHIVGGDLEGAINEGVRRGYTEGYLRKSVVQDPLFARTNTKDNTPAVIHTEIVPGDKLRITVLPKGGGSENMTRLAMLKPSDGVEGVKKFIVQTVDQAGPNPCPPVIVGVGVGGTSDKTMYLAKRALLRKVGERNSDPKIADLEVELLNLINGLGIGPQGLGGRVTALDVHIETFPSHIASLPVAVNLQCHSARQESAEL